MDTITNLKNTDILFLDEIKNFARGDYAHLQILLHPPTYKKGFYCRDKMDLIKRLSAPTKNKLIRVSEYIRNYNIGNTKLAGEILASMQLEDIYLDSEQRQFLSISLNNSLDIIKKEEEGKQCKDVLSNYINFQKRIGSGLFGEIYQCTLDADIAEYNNYSFVVKMAIDNSSPEYHIGNLLNQLVFNNTAQNLPVISDYYNCDRCVFESKSVRKQDSKCVFSIHELATGGDLYDWLSKRQDEKNLNSALFQIMAGIHAIQYHYGIVHFDIKAENILIYNVNPGGYWKYTIYGRDFYVPNYGKLFVIGDFGLAKIFYPDFKYEKDKIDGYTSLGDRPFIINQGQFEPLNNPQKNKSFIIKWENNVITNINRILFDDRTNKILLNPVLNQSQKDLIGYDSDNLMFYNSKLVPPLEFMIDTQDVIRMFTGGKNMAYNSNHPKYVFTPDFTYRLRKYELNIGNNMNYQDFLYSNRKQSVDLAKMIAGYFILDYFTTEVDYTIPIDKDLIISHIKTS